MGRLQVSRILAILAALFSVLALIKIWPQIAAYQAMGPLPGLYLLEMVGLPLVSIALTFLDGGSLLVSAEARFSSDLCWLPAKSWEIYE